MYEVDERDRVVSLPDLPQSSVGAPIPVLLSDEFTLVIAFYLQGHIKLDERWLRIVELDQGGEPIAIVRFIQCYAYMFGPPNDEAFHGHPLAARGLHPYGAYVIEHSSWIRRLEQMNAVHPAHEPSFFSSLRHYVLAFHDSTLECVAPSYEIVLATGTPSAAIPEMRRMLSRERL